MRAGLRYEEKNHPARVATGRASGLFKEICLTYFRNIMKGGKNKPKRSAGTNKQSLTKKAKNSHENEAFP